MNYVKILHVALLPFLKKKKKISSERFHVSLLYFLETTTHLNRSHNTPKLI